MNISHVPIRQSLTSASNGRKTKGKCQEANSLKLAANGTYGKTNDKFSALFDPKHTMAVTINGQLLLSMLAERLMGVPSLRIIQVNTDGITYYIHESQLATGATGRSRLAASYCFGS
ncbi:MAG: hypothetical protein U5N55_11680 [Cypionkella sp.]|nr:hypothetical protein [Cypionkella sp.]